MNQSGQVKYRPPEHPCIACLRDTEERIRQGNVGSGNDAQSLWNRTWSQESKKLEAFLRHSAPQSVLEIGVGTGRIVQTVLDTLSSASIVGVESDPAMFTYAQQRFRQEWRVDLYQENIAEFLSKASHFDMALCMMNTFGNIDDPNVFREIVGHARRAVFSLYDARYDDLRKGMYAARGHIAYTLQDSCCSFQDWWVRGLMSRSYTKEEIVALVNGSGACLETIEQVGILHFFVV